MIALEPIGYVRNNCHTRQAPEAIRKEISAIEILPEYAEGLFDIEQSDYLDLVFALHQEKRTELICRLRTGETKGVFASRSPRRPNHIGITTVKLKKREGNTLYVEGADALDNSPVLDIKYCDTSILEYKNVHTSILLKDPRIDIIRQIMGNDTQSLLLKAAQLHGHVCPGLALGVMSAAKVMQELYNCGGNPNDYLLVSDLENCPVDGVLFVTGCTPGTDRFIQGKHPDKMRFCLKNKAGKGRQVSFRTSAKDKLQLPENLSPAEQGNAMLLLHPATLFSIEEIR